MAWIGGLDWWLGSVVWIGGLGIVVWNGGMDCRFLLPG